MKKIVLLFALLLSSMSLTVKADIYTDGMRKMLTEGMATYNPEDLMSSLRNAGIKEENLSYDDVIDIMVDFFAAIYRANFTDEQFEQYMTFYSQPKMAAVLKKNIQFSKSLKQEFETFMRTTTLLIKCDMKPSDLKATHCSKGYKAAFEKYWELNKYDYALSSTVDALEQAVADGDAQTKAIVQAVIAYLKKNMFVFVRNTLLETMNEEDLKLFLTVTEQPFAESVAKVGKVFTERNSEIAMVLDEKIKAKMYANMFGPIDNSPKPEIGVIEEDEDVIDEVIEEPKKEVYDDDQQVFLVAEQMPQFPGGNTAMYDFIKSNLHYPEACYKAKIEGRVIVQFIVEKDGSISDITVVRSSGSGELDKEAVRVIRKMPTWEPGRNYSGKVVRVKFTAPINFRIADEKE